MLSTTTPYSGNAWTHKTDGGNVLFCDGHTMAMRQTGLSEAGVSLFLADGAVPTFP